MVQGGWRCRENGTVHIHSPYANLAHTVEALIWPEALLKVLFKVRSPERLLPVDSAFSECLVITADHSPLIPPGGVSPLGPPLLGWVFELWQTQLAAGPDPCTVLTDPPKSFCGVLSLGCCTLSESAILLFIAQPIENVACCSREQLGLGLQPSQDKLR